MHDKKTCEKCNAQCCKYVCMEIDTPENEEDFDDIRWYLAHKNVNVFIEEEGTWCIEFLTPCEFLGEDNKCKNYENRPKICRDHSHEECDFYNGSTEKHTFRNVEEFNEYLKKNANKIKS